MNPEKNINENEKIELEEQAMGEPNSPGLSAEDEAQLSFEKLQENADSESSDERELSASFGEED